MRRITTAVALAALLTLTACSSGNDENEKSLTEQNEEELAALSFPDVDALSEHLQSELDVNDASLDESGGAIDGDLSISANSQGTELQDKNLTADILETVAHGVEFDYETVTVAILGDPGVCGNRYDRDTVEDFADNGIIITNIWDNAESTSGCNY